VNECARDGFIFHFLTTVKCRTVAFFTWNPFLTTVHKRIVIARKTIFNDGSKRNRRYFAVKFTAFFPTWISVNCRYSMSFLRFFILVDYF